MAGQSASKDSQKIKGIKILAEGARLGKNFDMETASASTYAGLLELLLPTNHTNFISREELDEIGQNIYGENWKNLVYDWKKIPHKNILIEQEV